MAYKMKITQAAYKDLDEILYYLTKQLANPSAAAKLLAQIEECYAQLMSFPFLYEACRDARLQSLGYHKVTFGNYVMVFQPSDPDQTVYILRFFYGGRNYESML